LKVLLDHNISEHLKPLLVDFEVFTAKEMLWNRLKNGELLRAGEQAGFQVMLTGDQNIWYQQNNKKRQIALVVVNTTLLAVLAAEYPIGPRSLGQS
jgi:hypothetical protein